MPASVVKGHKCDVATDKDNETMMQISSFFPHLQKGKKVCRSILCNDETARVKTCLEMENLSHKMWSPSGTLAKTQIFSNPQTDFFSDQSRSQDFEKSVCRHISKIK